MVDFFGLCLSSAQPLEKLPSTKFAGVVVDPKIGIATCITSAESTGATDARFCETVVKEPVLATAGRSDDVSQSPLLQETEVKQRDSSSFSFSETVLADSENNKGLVSLHEDQSLTQQDHIDQNVISLESDACSNSCNVSPLSSDTSSAGCLNFLWICICNFWPVSFSRAYLITTTF